VNGRHMLVLLALLLFSPLGGCDRLPGRPSAADRYARPETILDMGTLFAANCSGCHGEPGRIGPARDLGDPLFLAVIGRSELRRVIAEGIAGKSMPAFAQREGGWLTEAQIDALADGILARWGTPAAFKNVALPPYSEAAARKAGLAEGDASRGAAVFARYCADCHGARGDAGRGGSIVEGSYLALVSDQALRSVVIAGRPELHSPSFQAHPGRPPMGFQQISDLTAWLVSQRRAFPGGPHPTEAVTATTK
jgi:cytochrome c oxidase cbb3-type subunit 3